MNISRTQSYVLGVGTLALFFLSSILMLRNVSIPKSSDHETTISGETKDPVPVTTEGGPVSPLTLNNFHRSEVRNGKKLWEVSAEKGRYFPQTQSAELEKATIFLYRDDGGVVQLTTAKASLLFNAAALRSAEVRGDVVLTYEDKFVVKTDFAIYDRDKNSVAAPGQVNIENESMSVTGTELAADIEKKEFLLKQDVSSIIKPKRRSP